MGESSASDFIAVRLAWLDQVHDDPEMLASTAAVAFHLSRFFSREKYEAVGLMQAWPSHVLLAERSHSTDRSVRRALDQLRAGGHLSSTGKGGRQCPLTYFPVLKKPGRACPTLTENPDAGVLVSANKPGQMLHKTRTSVTENPDAGVLRSSLKKPLMNLFDGAQAREKNLLDLNITEELVSVAAISLFSKGPGKLPPTSRFIAKHVAEGKTEWALEHQAKHGWRDLDAKVRDCLRARPSLASLALEMVPVVRGSATWIAWSAEFARRGWPFSSMARLPLGGPEVLDDFISRINQAEASDDMKGKAA